MYIDLKEIVISAENTNFADTHTHMSIFDFDH